MKLSIFILSLFYFSVSYSQLPMLEENHVWNIDLHGSFFGEDPYIITNQITVSGETVINGKSYKSVINNVNEDINCLVREENGIVYMYSESFNDDVILYDFTLEIGDNFTFLPNNVYCSFYGESPNIPFTAEVINTSVQFIANKNRKVIEFGFVFENEETWIEGIGSIRGFDPIGVVLDIIDLSELVCFSDDSGTYYFNNATSCDNTTLGIEDLSIEGIVLYPNPVVNQSILNIPLETNANKIQIITINGEVIKEEHLNKDYYIINTMDFSSGVYFYQIFDTNKLLKTSKFIIK